MSAPPFPTVLPVEALTGAWAEVQASTELKPAGCDQCRSAFLATPADMGDLCPVCGKGRLSSQPALLRTEPPEKVAPFAVPPDALAGILAPFVNGVWLRPDDFEPGRLLSRIAPLYWPMWLVDCDLDGHWQAEVGYDYQVQSSQETYQQGNWRTDKVIETRARWEPRLGEITRRYENIATPALAGQEDLLRDLGAYRLEAAVSFEPGLLSLKSGPARLPAILHVPNLQPEHAWPQAQVELHQAAADECRKAAGGQHIRKFTLQSAYRSLNWTQLLLPVYSTYYLDDDGIPHVILIHGQTGRIAGTRLASQRKGWRWAALLGGASLGVFVLALLAFALTYLLAPLALVGGLLVALAVFLALAAVAPAVWPWQWNRQERFRRGEP